MFDTRPADSRTNAAEYTVSEISGALKRSIEENFGNVRVRGEISGFRGVHGSGHAYFCLKDERARLDAVIWKSALSRMRFLPEEGMEVIASGRLTTYPGSSKYQIVIDKLEPAGAGALMALLEERKRRLAAEGLFADERKRPLPFMPRVIGVVTSPTGAVIRDIIHRVSDRFPVHVLVWPVRVQGETTAAEVARAVSGFNLLGPGDPVPRPDVLIVARGGGSLEDLWGFNDEALARVVAASDIPVISAVGHETDWTLIDFVADIRAPTPTGAAEMAVPVKADLVAAVAALHARLSSSVSRGLDRLRQKLRATGRALPSADQLLALPRRRFDEATSRLERGLRVNTDLKRQRLSGIRLSPAMLERRILEVRRQAGRDLARAGAALRGILRARQSELARTGARLPKCAETHLRQLGRRLEAVALRLSIEPAARRQAAYRERLAILSRRHGQAMAAKLERLERGLAQSTRLLATLSHEAVLARGFALVSDEGGSLVKSASAVTPGQRLSLRFFDGKAEAVAVEPSARPPRPRTQPKRPPSDDQGSLF